MENGKRPPSPAPSTANHGAIRKKRITTKHLTGEQKENVVDFLVKRFFAVKYINHAAISAAANTFNVSYDAVLHIWHKIKHIFVNDETQKCQSQRYAQIQQLLQQYVEKKQQQQQTHAQKCTHCRHVPVNAQVSVAAQALGQDLLVDKTKQTSRITAKALARKAKRRTKQALNDTVLKLEQLNLKEKRQEQYMHVRQNAQAQAQTQVQAVLLDKAKQKPPTTAQGQVQAIKQRMHRALDEEIQYVVQKFEQLSLEEKYRQQQLHLNRHVQMNAQNLQAKQTPMALSMHMAIPFPFSVVEGGVTNISQQQTSKYQQQQQEFAKRQAEVSNPKRSAPQPMAEQQQPAQQESQQHKPVQHQHKQKQKGKSRGGRCSRPKRKCNSTHM